MGDVTDFRNVLGAVIDRRAFDLHVNRKKSTVNIATHAGITGRYLEMIEAGTTTPSLPVLRKLDGIRIGLARSQPASARCTAGRQCCARCWKGTEPRPGVPRTR